MSIKEDLKHIINSASRENESNTPDFILATYLYECLLSFEQAILTRDTWYGVHLESANKYFLEENK
jgi:hypothetical protein